MSDPADQLSNFDPGPAMQPIPPSDVRRQGDRLRRRRTVLAGVGAAVAVVLIATPLAIIGTRGDDRPEPAPPPPCRGQDCPEFRDALALAPDGAQSVSYVNRDLGAARLGLEDIGHDATQQDVDYYLRVTSHEEPVMATSFGEDLEVMHDKAAFSELDVDWEVLSMMPDHSLVTALRMDDRLDLEAVGDDLVDAGYAEESVDGRRSFTIAPDSPDYNGFSGLVSGRYPDMGRMTLVPDRQLIVLGDPALVPLDDAGSRPATAVFDPYLSMVDAPERAQLVASPECSTSGDLEPGDPDSSGIDDLGDPESLAIFFAAGTAATSSVLTFGDEQAARDDLRARTAYLEEQRLVDIAEWTIRRDGRAVVVDFAFDNPGSFRTFGMSDMQACWAADQPSGEEASGAGILDAEGVGALRLGMSPEEAEATGEATSTPASTSDGEAPGCEVLDFEPGLYDEADVTDQNGRISPDQGLEQIRGTSDMRTPEGIGIGSTRAEVLAAYAEVNVGDTINVLSIAASETAVYRLYIDSGPSGTVSMLNLELNDQDCEI